MRFVCLNAVTDGCVRTSVAACPLASMETKRLYVVGKGDVGPYEGPQVFDADLELLYSSVSV